MSFLRGYARKLGVPEYLGTWNAATNTPFITNSVGQRGGYYVVSQAGSTSIDGINDWNAKDWIIFNGTVWEKIDNSEENQVVNSFAGDETAKAPSVISVKNYVAAQSVALSSTFVVASESDMLTLSAAVGNLAVRTDLSKTFILKQIPASSLSNWQEIATLANVVTSVAGKTGSISLNTEDVLEGSNLYYTDARARSALSSYFSFSHEIHVAKNGTDSGSTGKPYQPFLTLGAAISYIESTFTSGESVAVYIHPGTYLENITIVRPKTHLIGIQKTNAFIAQIGSVTIAPTTATDGVYNSSFSIQNLLLSTPSTASAGLTIGGTAECSLHLRDVYVYASAAGQKGITVTNTSSVKSRFYFNDLLVNNQLCGATGIELANSVAQIKNTTIYSGSAICLKVKSTASVLAGFCLFETSGLLAVDLEATTLTLTTSSITATQANASGINVAAGATYTTIQNFYNIANGTGYAINGAVTGVVTHALNAFAFNTNNKYKNVLYMISHSTTMTASN